MPNTVLTYEGYALCSAGLAYKSLINGSWLAFDTAGQFIQYINKIIGNEK